MSKYSLFILFFLTAGIFIASCDKERTALPTPLATYRLNCTTQGSTLSRSSTDFETQVDKVLALVFEWNGEQELFAYTAEASLEDSNPSTGKYTVAVKLKQSEGAQQYRVVILANYSLEKPLTEWIGQPKNEVLKQLSFDASVSADGDYTWYRHHIKHLPMWGEAAIQEIHAETEFEQVQLLRALARVDVGFNYNVDEAGRETHSPFPNTGEIDNYKLASIHVYKSLKQGLVAPFSENIDANNEPIAPSIAYKKGEIPKTTYNTPITYNIKTPSEDQPYKGQIYITEQYAGTSKDTETTLTLVFGFMHTSYGEGVVRYFRADVMNEGSMNTEPALRGNRYIISISKMKGSGSKTPDEAFNRTATSRSKLESSSCQLSVKQLTY